MEMEKELKIVDIETKCSPQEVGYILRGGWNWNYDAIGRVSGTAGNLEKWALGHEHVWQSLRDGHTESRLIWECVTTKKAAWADFNG